MKSLQKSPFYKGGFRGIFKGLCAGGTGLRAGGAGLCAGGTGLCAGGTGLCARLKTSSRKPDCIGLSGIQTMSPRRRGTRHQMTSLTFHWIPDSHFATSGMTHLALALKSLVFQQPASDPACYLRFFSPLVNSVLCSPLLAIWPNPPLLEPCQTQTSLASSSKRNGCFKIPLKRLSDNS